MVETKLIMQFAFCFTGDFVKNQLKCVFNLLPAFPSRPEGNDIMQLSQRWTNAITTRNRNDTGHEWTSKIFTHTHSQRARDPDHMSRVTVATSKLEVPHSSVSVKRDRRDSGWKQQKRFPRNLWCSWCSVCVCVCHTLLLLPESL